MTFGTEVVLKGRKVLGGGGYGPVATTLGIGCIKGVWGASGASDMHFGKNLIKQKLQVTLSDPKYGSGRTWPHVLLEPWSLIWKISL